MIKMTQDSIVEKRVILEFKVGIQTLDQPFTNAVTLSRLPTLLELNLCSKIYWKGEGVGEGGERELLLIGSFPNYPTIVFH